MLKQRAKEKSQEKRLAEKLPRFVSPMLARSAKPFDSDKHLFEIKWDGIRALVFVESGKYRLFTRRGNEISSQFPELCFLSELPSGTILDGEIVLLRDNLPDFAAVLTRLQAGSPIKITTLSQSNPAIYVLFDVLSKNYESLMHLPLTQRREILRDIVGDAQNRRLIMSKGITGRGSEYYKNVCKMNLEGVMAKRLDSPYLPGKRKWLKIKPIKHAFYVIIGFVPEGSKDYRSLLLATADDEKLKYVGKARTGFTREVRKRLNRLLRFRLRENPIVECSEKAIWIESELYCTVRYSERTRSGRLRMPVFEKLILE